MKNSAWLSLAAVLAVGIFGITGCNDHQERYEDPPWLGGASIETLEDRGNYTIFLELMEKANYKDPITKQLFTLFVPDDAAFEAYFETAPYNSVEEMTEDDAIQLFTLHVLRNPRSRYYLIYEFVWNEFQGPKGEYAALFHRKPTPSESVPYKEIVKYTPGWEERELMIYTGKKNVPLWTTEWGGDYGSYDIESDYLFMYPGSSWEEGYPEELNGMNWHNAMVIPNPEIPEELEVRTASGFIYFLDRVVPPMPNIEEYMIANQDKYGLYYDLLQRFAIYGNQRIEEDRTVQYQKSYDLVYDLAQERGRAESPHPKSMWTAFLPPDPVLQTYLDNTVFQYYAHIDSVPRVTLYYILQSQLSGDLVIVSKLDNGYFNAFGDPTDLTASDLVSGYMCSNGCVYESSKVIEPNVFTTVPGILFFDKDYSTMLYVFNQANMLSTISSPDSDVTVFAATNEKMEEYGIRYDPTSNAVEFRGPIDGQWSPMKPTELAIFAQDQIYQGILDDLDGAGGFVEMSSKNYIHYANSVAGAGENQTYNQPVNILEVDVNDQNGLLVKVDYPIGSRLEMGQILSCPKQEPECSLADPEFTEFSAILEGLRLLDTRYREPTTKEFIPRLKFLPRSDYWTAFIPTNAAIAQARADGIIPVEFPTTTEGKDSLENFVKYHFVKESVIFDDGLVSGLFPTEYSYLDTVENVTRSGMVEIVNASENLAVVDITGQVVPVGHATANRLVRRGVIHKISSVLQYTAQ